MNIFLKKFVFPSCSRQLQKDESVTERHPGEDDVGACPLWAGLPLQSGVRGRGATSLLGRGQRSRRPPPGVKGLSGLLGMLGAGHCTEYGHRSDKRLGGQRRVRHHPHPGPHHDHIRLPLPLHSKNLPQICFSFLFLTDRSVTSKRITQSNWY